MKLANFPLAENKGPTRGDIPSIGRGAFCRDDSRIRRGGATQAASERRMDER